MGDAQKRGDTGETSAGDAQKSAGVMRRRGGTQGETSAGVMCAEEGRLRVSRGDAQKKGGKTRG